MGVVLFTGLLLYFGVGNIGAALALAGPGLLAVTAFHVVPLLANVLGWRCLLTGSVPRPFATLLLARWISESVNGLLPVLQIGGNVVRARWIALRGVPSQVAGASVVADVTFNFLTQIVFTLLGLGLLLVQFGGSRLAAPVLIGVAIMGSLLAAFYLTQRRGLFGGGAWLLARISSRFDHTALASGAAELDEAVRALYHERRAVLAACAWHLVSWILGAGEIWLGLYFLQQPVAPLDALVMESLGQAIRTAAFVVPAALGVQEGGFILLGAAFGIGPDIALALSLIKRVRELLLGVPGLLVWQFGAASRMIGRNRHR